MSDLVLAERDGAIARLMLNDPASRNALSFDMIGALARALQAARDARVVIIAAKGAAFSSGHNLREIAAHRNDRDRGERFFAELMRVCTELMTAIVKHPCPVIAEVQGIATAAGCQLVASCDLAVAAEAARFATPGVDIGLFCSTPMVALSRNVAAKPALEMLFTAEPIDAPTALRIGLVNRVVPAAKLSEETRALAERIAAKPASVVKLGKAAFHRQREMGLEAAYAETSRVMVENLLMRESDEGIRAFLDKRPPNWDASS
jgi:enoyl-CoA hydratase/carnithine racemase